MDEIKITSYSLIALLILAVVAFVYTCRIINFNGNTNGANSKIVAGFKA